MQESNSIKNWAEDERPREKMLHKGPISLSDAELLGILISSGTREKSAIDLAREILSIANGNLLELGKLGLKELQKVKGIGEAKAISIAAAMELGRRRQLSEALERPSINSSAAALPIVRPLLQDLTHEVFCVLYLNNAGKLLRHELLSSGGMTATVVDVRMVLKNCLLHNANRFIVAHNHPSGNPNPSQADINMTRQLQEAAKIMDITLLDHIIIAGDSFTSLADEGHM